MVYVNIEYLAKDGNWRAFSTCAYASGELMMRAVAGLIESWWGIEWRMRVRH